MYESKILLYEAKTLFYRSKILLKKTKIPKENSERIHQPIQKSFF